MTDNLFEPLLDVSEQNMKHAHAAYDELMTFVTKAMDAWMGAVALNPLFTAFKEIQKDSVDSAFAFSGKISTAPMLPEILTLQAQFAQDWMQVLTARTQETYGSIQEFLQKADPGALNTGAGVRDANLMVTNFKDIQDRAEGMAKKNAEAAFALVEKIDKAENIQAIWTLKAQFARKQVQAYVAQADELKHLIGDAFQKPQHG